ncbi:MAG: transposase, partial [Kofleriaceae bacterium]
MSEVELPSVPQVERRGGKRVGAGRKKTGRCRDAPHRKRPVLERLHPVHVVLRHTGRLSWRTRTYYDHVRRALRGMLGRDDFRVCHISIQDTHLHLLVEAVDRKALARGMQSFAIRLARQVHSDGGCGKVFEYRYHATQIRTASHARHALSYVLNNWRRHRLDVENGRVLTQKLDVYGSGIGFDGWIDRRPFDIPRGYEPLPVSRAQTALLGFEWQRYGLIDFFETP